MQEKLPAAAIEGNKAYLVEDEELDARESAMQTPEAAILFRSADRDADTGALIGKHAYRQAARDSRKGARHPAPRQSERGLGESATDLSRDASQAQCVH